MQSVIKSPYLLTLAIKEVGGRLVKVDAVCFHSIEFSFLFNRDF